ncbi:unnamed protein product, partial [Didymodactylos carnosus]
MYIPVEIFVYDTSKIEVEQKFYTHPVVRTQISYKVNISNAGLGNLNAEVFHNDYSYACQIQDISDKEFLIQYVPLDTGIYKLNISFNNELVGGKPFIVDVRSSLTRPTVSLSPSNIKLRLQGPLDAEIGDNVIILVTTDVSLKSPVYALVTCNSKTVPSRVESIDQKSWHVHFKPYITGNYTVNVFHNGAQTDGSSINVQIRNSSGKVLLSGLEQTVLINSTCVIQVHVESVISASITAGVSLGIKQIPLSLNVVNNNLVRIQFIPQEPGLYAVDVRCGNMSVEGMQVDWPKVAQVSGECFNRLRLGELGVFIVHCNGQKGVVKAKAFSMFFIYFYLYTREENMKYYLDLSVGDRIDMQPISFQLKEPCDVLLQFASQLWSKILTSLLTTRLLVTPDRITKVSLGKENGNAICTFQLHEKLGFNIPPNDHIIEVLRHLVDTNTLYLLDPSRRPLNTLKGTVFVGPKGEQVQVKLFPQASGDYSGEFTPTKVGQHRIDITFANVPLKGSPFFTEVYDPSAVKILNVSKEIFVGSETSFEVNLENAGNVPLDIKITTSTGTLVPLKIEDSTSKSLIKKVRFQPNENGILYINAKIGSEAIQGTPFKITVNDARSVTVHGEGLYHAQEDRPANFFIDTKDMQGDLKVRIEGPNSVIKNTLERTNDDLFKVTYIPVEVGFHNISIKWNGKDIDGSPLKAAVTNSERVRVVGGWQSILDVENRMRLLVNEEKKIRFDTAHAGPGSLKADVRDIDGRIPIRLDQQGSLYTVSFTAVREGKYDINVTYDNNLLPNMPLRAIATNVSGQSDHIKVEVYGRGSHEARVNEEAEFTIDGTKAGSGIPSVRLTGTKSDVDIRIKSLENNVYSCSYIPSVPGVYLLSVTWADRQVRGSPFKINVLPAGNASKVVCTGDGLRTGVMGKEIKCLIDTRSAGPGELTAYCQGSSKTAFCRLFDHRDGTFTLYVKPQEAGRHVLTIRYNDEHVPGSPYTLKISGAPDANKVRVSGPGIEHGVLSTFQSRFTCETKGAGAGQLTVKIRGPKGAFRVEMQREHLQDRTIMCRYNPTE